MKIEWWKLARRGAMAAIVACCMVGLTGCGDDDEEGDGGGSSGIVDPSDDVAPTIVSYSFDQPAKTLTVIFSEPMQQGYYTTGDYHPDVSYWIDNTTFRIDFITWVSGGMIVLKTSDAQYDGFMDLAGNPIDADYPIAFP
ncbi:hypothetical protein PDESU_05172 [Pontiella desulfatans]|uniref:SbsA Ig-like domain-containing protein n=1 Tax=Pontiella desulfatans TaxID=2750659 RepID=A0A6C2UAN6_PONDE|nr:Ig-like domain-containing protein [Pontiella desulfatans]VGO16581.1 hypothetical protein PDESU_05172 [Pontiella desulfatans]